MTDPVYRAGGRTSRQPLLLELRWAVPVPTYIYKCAFSTITASLVTDMLRLHSRLREGCSARFSPFFYSSPAEMIPTWEEQLACWRAL